MYCFRAFAMAERGNRLSSRHMKKTGIFLRKLWHIAGRAESCRVHLWCRGDLREWRVTEISLGPWVWLWGITHCQHTPQIWKVRMGSAERSGLLVHLKKPIPGTNPCPRPQTFGTQKDLVDLRQGLFWQKQKRVLMACYCYSWFIQPCAFMT